MAAFLKSKKKYLMLLGCTILTMLGSMQTNFGNLLPYIVSYYEAHATSVQVPVSAVWVVSAFKLVQPIGMMIAGFMERKISQIHIIAIGAGIMCGAMISTAWSLQEPLGLVATFGVLQGIGAGCVMGLCNKLATDWMPTQHGLAISIINTGFGFYPLINMPLAFYMINPQNVQADLKTNNIYYFTDPLVIERVAPYFWKVGLFQAALSFMAMFFISMKKDEETNSMENLITCTIETEENPSSLSTKTDRHNEETTIAPVTYGSYKETNIPNLFDIRETNKGEHPQNNLCHKCMDANGETPNHPQNTQNKIPATSPPNTHKAKDLHPRQVLLSPLFWHIWIMSLCMSHVLYNLQLFFKQFGQTVINDDHLLVVTGIVSAMCNILTMPLAGIAADRFGFKQTILIAGAVMNTSVTMTPISLYNFPELYPLFVATGIAACCSVFALHKLAPLAYFGHEYYSSNMGLLATTQTFLFLIEPFITQYIIANLGWVYLLLSCTTSSALGVFLCLSLPDVDL